MMHSYHPMVWQYQIAKRLRWWMNLPLRPLNVFGYIVEYVWKLQSWWEWKVVNRVVIWYANRNAPPGWEREGSLSWYREGFSDGLKEIFNEENLRSKEPDET